MSHVVQTGHRNTELVPQDTAITVNWENFSSRAGAALQTFIIQTLGQPQSACNRVGFPMENDPTPVMLYLCID